MKYKTRMHYETANEMVFIDLLYTQCQSAVSKVEYCV